jgi:hypothetical protein
MDTLALSLTTVQLHGCVEESGKVSSLAIAALKRAHPSMLNGGA